MIGDMTGKAALVTGAAAGLGRATALLLAGAGAKVALVDRDETGLAETAALIDGFTLIHPANLADPDACAAAVAATVEAFGRFDALCNVAGVFLPAHSADMAREAFELTLAVNLAAPFHLIQAALPHLLETKGAVVNVTSCAAHAGQAYCAAYCASKAGLTHMTKALAMEYIHRGIRFNAVAPGGMMTNLAMGIRSLPDPDIDLLKRFSPLRGLVEIDTVARMVAFLASPAAEGYHGAVINIDNGITAG
jgi:NAD(P)-dependent dehydrogenase (short-subunit alcohol dehydrogenase family)